MLSLQYDRSRLPAVLCTTHFASSRKWLSFYPFHSHVRTHRACDPNVQRFSVLVCDYLDIHWLMWNCKKDEWKKVKVKNERKTRSAQGASRRE